MRRATGPEPFEDLGRGSAQDVGVIEPLAEQGEVGVEPERPPFLVEVLERHKKEQNQRRLLCGSGWTDFDLVFDRGEGAPVSPTNFTQRVGKIARKAGLDITPHSLRHGNATLSLAAGIDLKVTQERLGHSSIAITGDLYTHLGVAIDREAADKLDALLAPLVAEGLTRD